ncbi:hypothetical protein AN618_17000 [Fervidicola ferrireducens]|uniref:Type II secretion system protein J n=1 Tax=Fervidicola ferrireducens TaxID=520764 RepID=A0A140L653_9FIRM|nr:prepilin-type N-terminal cleavage/methylation domain-containing protein [Fervidicola ferrireducens]KXG76028.1 hypothetical protein AN618_17000 [Fervidicola ferrireducens]
MRKEYQAKGGFTLVEVVVALSVFTLVIGAALALYQQAVISWRKDERRVDVQENLSFALEKMSEEIRSAKRVVEGKSSRLGLVVNKEDEGLEDGEEIVYYSFDSQKGRLLREQGHYVQPLASYVTYFNLEYYGEYTDEAYESLEEPLSGEELEKVRLIKITVAGKKVNSPEMKVTTSVRIRALD